MTVEEPQRSAARPQPLASGVMPGTGAYRRIGGAFFLAGFASFSLLYCVQPLLPVFSQEFGVDPATSSLSLSLSTGFLALAIFAAAIVSEGLGRRGLMFASMVIAAVLNIAVAFAPNWPLLLGLRAAEGLVLGGVPAVAMAYLSEEMDRRGLGFAMGLYISGNAFGGMMGRLGTGIASEFLSWRPAVALMGGAGLLAALGFIALVPPSRRFTRRAGFEVSYHVQAWARHLRDPSLPFLFAIAFLAMGAFVTVYNYIGFRLLGPPYQLNQTQLGLIFTVYLFGIASSSLAGVLADRVGRGRVLTAGLVIAAAGIALTLAATLSLIIAGMVVMTSGFFMAHSAASSWVGRLAKEAKGHASSLYLLAYYLGSSIAGSAGGWFYARDGWPAIVGFTVILLSLALLAAWRVVTVTRGVATARF